MVEAPTAGATADSVVVKIYFEDLPAEGDFKLTATQNVGTAPAEQKFNTNTLSVASTTFTFAEALTDGGTSYVLSKIVLGAAPAGISLDYTSPNAVVTVPLSDQIAEGTYNVATATYAEGTLGADETLSAALVNGEWVFTKKTKPVAIIVAGNVTNEYPSLRGAITNATAGDTIYLVADDRVSFTADDPILDIDFEVTIDGGSNTLYGMTGYAAGYHEIRVGGNSNVTIKDLKLTEFGDTAVRNDSVMPIVARSAYTGKLTLDGVQIDKFNRQALCLFGGTFEITNCVITGSADTATGNYFQSAIEVFNAEGTVAATTISGIGSNLPVWGAASCFNLNSDWSQTPWVGGTGSITILSGSYTGQYIVLGMTNAAQTVDIQGGTFIATAPAADSAFGLDDQSTGDPSEASITISGGWFDREPEAKFLAKGYRADEAAPGTDTPWTVVLGNAIWIGGASGDWNVPANWDIGCLPTTTTVVTFTNDAQVAICNTDACKEMVLTNAVVTLGRASGVAQPILRFYGDEERAVSVASGATGSLAVNGISLFNEVKDEDDLKIDCALEILGDVTFRGVSIVNKSKSASFTITGKTTVSATARLSTIDFGTTKFQGGIEVAKGVTAKITTNPDGGATIGTGVTLVANDGAGDPTAIWLMQVSSKAVLLDGTSVSVDAAHAETFRVKKGSESDTGTYGGDCIVYKALRTYNITFKPENGTPDIVTNVFADVTEYAPADPAPAEEGFTFVGWTNVLDATTVYTGNPMPAAAADATYAAKYEANAVEVTAVDPGQSMSADEKAANPPVEVTAAGFTVHFKGVAGVTYELLAAESLSVTQTQWENPDGTTVTVVDTVDVTANTAANVQTLTAPMTGNGVPTARFFKIGAKQTE